MSAPAPHARRSIQAALARATYADDHVRLTGASLAGCECLFASRQGVFGVARDGRLQRLAFGHFFGVHAHDGWLYLFEACDRPHAPTAMGRIVRLRRDGDRLVEPVVLAKGLDNQCHQIAIFDGALWVVDTANQAVLHFTLEGAAVARHTPLPPVPAGDASGAYRHINSIAKVGERIVLMLHNGGTPAGRPSELAWLDRDLSLCERVPIAGEQCHDIFEGADGVLWHCGSMAGELINSAGLRHKISDTMTRGLAVAAERIVVGSSNFAVREARDEIAGHVHFLDRDLALQAAIAVPAAPTDLILL